MIELRTWTCPLGHALFAMESLQRDLKSWNFTCEERVVSPSHRQYLACSKELVKRLVGSDQSFVIDCWHGNDVLFVRVPLPPFRTSQFLLGLAFSSTHAFTAIRASQWNRQVCEQIYGSIELTLRDTVEEIEDKEVQQKVEANEESEVSKRIRDDVNWKCVYQPIGVGDDWLHSDGFGTRSEPTPSHDHPVKTPG